MSTYYVRTDGSDSNTGLGNNSALAWLTLIHACDTVVAGDTIEVVDNLGKWTEYTGDAVCTHAGTADAPIVIEGITGDLGSDYLRVKVKEGMSGNYLIQANSYWTIKNLWLYGNGVTYPVNVSSKSNVTVENSVVEESDAAGIIFNACTDILVKNCTLVGVDDFGVAAIYFDATTGAVKNTIIKNWDYGCGGGSGNTVVWNYNCWDDIDNWNYNGGAPSGTGNLADTDPLFVDWANLDLYLQATSPCRDTGDPADSVPAGGGTRIDIGAYEYYVPAEEYLEPEPREAISNISDIRAAEFRVVVVTESGRRVVIPGKL